MNNLNYIMGWIAIITGINLISYGFSEVLPYPLAVLFSSIVFCGVGAIMLRPN